MNTWLKDNGPVIGALAGVVVAIVAALQFVVVGPLSRDFQNLRMEMNARFDAQDRHMNARFDDVNQRFDDVNQRFDDLRGEMNTRFDVVNQRFNDLRDDMDKRFEAVNERLDGLTGEVSELRKLTVSITERVSRNEAQIDLITERLQPAPTQGP